EGLVRADHYDCLDMTASIIAKLLPDSIKDTSPADGFEM
ncbi:MAG: hypothetical protein QOG61_1663, partial [Candidatus Binataceae bacterium]|nr:hypothetical protein [Candidatus Binataceae bacterium]